MSELPLPLAAFLAGIISFLSPCVLPLVPGYVSLISGSSVEQLREGDPRLLRKVMINSVMFILGFTAVFLMLGAVASTLGQVLRQYYSILGPIAGLIIIVFGLHLTGILPIKALYSDKRLHGVQGRGTAISAFFLGFAFAFGWTPCVGPILSVVLGFASSEETIWRGTFLLLIYSLGLAIPFLITSVALSRFLEFYSRFRRHLGTLEKISGVLLIFIGALVMFGKFSLLSNWINTLPGFREVQKYL